MRAGWMVMVAALAACAPADTASTESTTKPDPLTGAWRSKVGFASGPFAAIDDFEFMYVFHGDGTLMESSNYDAAPPAPPAYGVWKKTGPATYQAHYEFFLTKPPKAVSDLPNGWLPSGRGELEETITLSADGRSFTSRMQFQSFDGAGKAVGDKAVAKGEGKRMGVAN